MRGPPRSRPCRPREARSQGRPKAERSDALTPNEVRFRARTESPEETGEKNISAARRVLCSRWVSAGPGRSRAVAEVLGHAVGRARRGCRRRHGLRARSSVTVTWAERLGIPLVIVQAWRWCTSVTPSRADRWSSTTSRSRLGGCYLEQDPPRASRGRLDRPGQDQRGDQQGGERVGAQQARRQDHHDPQRPPAPTRAGRRTPRPPPPRMLSEPVSEVRTVSETPVGHQAHQREHDHRSGLDLGRAR